MVTGSKLRALLDRCLGLIWILDDDGSLHLCVGEGMVDLDAEGEAWEGRRYDELDLDPPAIAEGLRDALEGEASCGLSIIGERLYELRFLSLRDEEDNLTGAALHAIPIDAIAPGSKEQAWQSSLLERTFHGIPDAVFVIDDRTRTIVACNPAAERIFGYDRDELLGSSTRMLHVDDDRYEEFGERSRPDLDASGTFTTEFRMRRQDGSVFTSEHIVSTVEDEEGTRVAAVSWVRDITDKERSRQELRHAMERFRAIFEGSPIGILFVRNREILEANDAVLELFGYDSADDVVGHPVDSFLHPDDRRRVAEIIRSRKDGDAPREYEVRGIREDGEEVDLLVRGGVVELAEGDANVGFLLDIGDRKRAQEELEERERYFRALTETSAHTISVLDEEGVVRFMTPNVVEVLGIPRESFEGRPIFEFVHPDDLEILERKWREILDRPGERVSVEIRLRDAEGSWRYVRNTGRNLLEDDVVSGVVVNSLDVSEQRQLREQLFQSQKLEAIGSLAGGVAHDFNNLLTPMMGYAEIVASQLPEDSPLRDDIDQVRDAAERAAALTKQLLAVGRRQLMQPKRLDLNRHIVELERLLQRTLGENIELTTDLDPQLPRVRLDPGQLDQVLLNLAVNAKAAMPRGGTLALTTRTVERLEPGALNGGEELTPGRYARMVVADSGTGIPEHLQSRIFEPFFTTKTESEGTGLGLATVYGIVRQSHGAIGVESQPDEGTRFILDFPADPMEPGTRAEPVAGDSDAEPPRAELLVVDDSDAVRSFLRRALERTGHSVLTAASASEAMEQLARREGAVDVVLVDIGLPDRSGLDVQAEIQERWPGLPVVLLSGYPDRELRQRGVPEGVRFLSKPVAVQDLQEVIRATLSPGDGDPSGAEDEGALDDDRG